MYLQSIFFFYLSTLDNNYLILNYLEQPELSLDYAILAKHMTNPCNGISSEKMIILLPSKIANFKMITYNPDGSRAKTCANGLRVVGHYLLEIGRFNQEQLSIETDSNISLLTHEDDLITVDLGLAHSLINPLHLISLQSQLSNYCAEIKTRHGMWTADMISMGNSHFIFYTDDDHELFFEDMKQISNEYDVNVGILTVINQNELLLTTYEHGLGLKTACGTNAAAAVSSAIARHLISPHELITVYVPGGELHVKWNEESHLIQMGRCHKVCCGTYFFEDTKKAISA